jgi:hypothetical protein
MLVIFLPSGAYILWTAFSIEGSPHAFVMFIFSGSLMSLIGVCGFLGLVTKTRHNITEDKNDEKPPAESSRNS